MEPKKDSNQHNPAPAETHMAPRAAEIDRSEAYPWDHVERLRALGMLGMTIPKELGGAGLGYLEAAYPPHAPAARGGWQNPFSK